MPASFPVGVESSELHAARPLMPAIATAKEAITFVRDGMRVRRGTRLGNVLRVKDGGAEPRGCLPWNTSWKKAHVIRGSCPQTRRAITQSAQRARRRAPARRARRRRSY